MTTKNRPSHADQMAADQGLIDGFTKHAPTFTTLLLEGTVMQTSDIVLVLRARIAAIKLAIAARAAFMAAVARARAELASTAELVSGTRQVLQIAFRAQFDTLNDFGLPARKVPTPLTAEQKVVAVEKAMATRKARHTMGPKQKAKITGETAAAARQQ